MVESLTEKSITEQSIKVVVLAQYESRRLGQSFVGTEQILLGTLSEETSVAAKVLKSKGVTLEHARIEVEKIIGRGSDFVPIDIPPFSPKARRVDPTKEAVEEAQLLLRILSKETSEAEVVKVLNEVEKIIGRGSDFSDFIAVDIPFSPKACRALDLAKEEAQQLGLDYINTEHLLLGTLRIEDGIALQVLANLGVDATEVRDLVVRMLGENTEG
jgi:ATP-dependent Clp protease ATP-binding subunit ClpA